MRNLLLALFLAPCLCYGDRLAYPAGKVDRDALWFFGLGLNMGQTTLNPSGTTASSQFNSRGYLGEGGLTMPFDIGYGVQYSAEFGVSNTTNTLVSETYLETGTLNYFSGKVGFYLGAFTVGGGYRYNELITKSISTLTPGYLKSVYNGWTSLGFANYTVDFQTRLRGVIEAQYMTGNLKNIDSASPSTDLNEISISLRVFFLF